jgi:arylsulfatase A-like enzyme
MFTRFYANASCSPTRAMLLSGTDNHVAGVGVMHEGRIQAPADAVVPRAYDGYLGLQIAALPEVLQANGYTTIMAGKWHLGYSPPYFPNNRGFDHSFALLEGGAAHFKQGNMGGAAYAGMVTALDREVGRLIGHLRNTGQYENTIIVFMSDNGAEGFERASPEFLEQFDTSLDNIGYRNSFVEYGPAWAQVANTPNRMWKLTGYEGGNRVPAFIHYPALVAPGISETLVTVTDIYPTILDLTGAAHPGNEFRGRAVAPIQGVSLVPVLRGDATDAHPVDFAIGFEVNRQASLHMRDWKIVYSAGFADTGWQLFNMSSTAGERMDLSASNPERLATMLDLWAKFAMRNGVVIGDTDRRPLLPF